MKEEEKARNVVLDFPKTNNSKKKAATVRYIKLNKFLYLNFSIKRLNFPKKIKRPRKTVHAYKENAMALR